MFLCFLPILKPRLPFSSVNYTIQFKYWFQLVLGHVNLKIKYGVNRSNPGSRVSEISTAFLDVGGYLASPFFVLQVAPDKEKELMTLGGWMRILGFAIDELRKIVEKHGLSDFKFTLLLQGEDNKMHPLAKSEFIKISTITERFHRSGLQHYLYTTPAIVKFVEEKYVEDVKEGELVEERKVKVLPTIGTPIFKEEEKDATPVIIRVYTADSVGIEAKEKLILFRKEKKEKELTREEVEKILRNYDPEKAKLLASYGRVLEKEFDGKLFAEYRIKVEKGKEGFVEKSYGFVSRIFTLEKSFEEIASKQLNEAIFNLALRYEIYYPVGIKILRKGESAEIIYIALVKKRKTS